jgi:hypothetical protein
MSFIRRRQMEKEFTFLSQEAGQRESRARRTGNMRWISKVMKNRGTAALAPHN